MSVLEANEVIVHYDKKTRNYSIYCRACGTMVKMENERYEKHTHECAEKFKPLRKEDPVPNEVTAAYVNLAEHLQKGEILEKRPWPYKKPSRTEARRLPMS